MAKMVDQYDFAFLGILQNEGKLVNFLDVIFCFLYRRTDFYVEMKTSTEKMGFPVGVAKKLVLQAFKKYEAEAKKKQETQKKMLEAAKQSKEPEKEPVSDVVPPAASNLPEEYNLPLGDIDLESCSSAEPLTREETLSMTCDTESADAADTNKTAAQSENVIKVEVKEEPPSDTGQVSDDNNSELAIQQQRFQDNPESYNGAIRDKYSWSQSITDTDIRIWVPEHVRKGKDVRVEIQRKRIKASNRTPSGEWVEIIDGELMWDINKEESMWTLEPGKCILINVEKVQERWWEAVLTDEPKISVRKIDPSRPITDLDDEAQAKIEEMMYNEHQKKLGRPQSHEQKVHDMLKKAWDVEGSPFKGQPFDPSKVNVSAENMMNFPAPPK